MIFIDYYKTLGVPFDASAEDIKAGHRAMSKRFHPDVNTEDDAFYEDRFKDIQEAYKVLSDPNTRKLYDRAYKRFGKNAISVGNELHMRGASTGDSLYSWHPDYRKSPARPLLNKKMSLFLGLAVAAVSVIFAAVFYGGGSKVESNVADTYLYNDEPISSIAVKETNKTDSVPVIAALDKKETITLKETAQPAPEAGPAVVSPRHVAEKPVAALTKPKPVAKEPVKQKPLPQKAVVMPPARIVAANKPVVPVSAPDKPTPDKNGRIVFTKNAAMPKDIQFGYMVFVVKRHLQYTTITYDNIQMVNYTSPVLPYGPLAPVERVQLLNNGMAVCSRNEDKFATTGSDKITFRVVSCNLKTFKTEAEAIASLRREKKSIHIADMKYY